jgi:gamma-glutamyl hercynylcysteine S-oxide synthase
VSTQSLAPVKKESLRSIRAQTLQLFDLVTSEKVLRVEPMPGFRPLLWHLAHIGVYQNYWVLQRCAGQSSINPTYDVHFDPIKTPREEATVLPSRDEIEAYLRETLHRVERFLDDADLAQQTGNGTLSPRYVFDLVVEHEMQHQETIAFVMQSLPLSNKKPGPGTADGARAGAAEEIFITPASAVIGGTDASFAYDNELPRHSVELKPFFIDRDLTTNSEYLEFVAAGGYGMRELWSEDGWQWKESAGVNRPLYWSGPPWHERGFFSETALRDDAPVTGVSCFEAEAYAAFRGKRLPTESEWEFAASWDPQRAVMQPYPWGNEPATPGLERSRTWGTTPVGWYPENASALGVRDVIGNLWQWTSSQFRGYPGFQAFPYPEYSEAWFDGDHRVSRGGSWFTDRALARTSFRNFYRRRFRQAFNGIRCARDAR